MIDTVDPAARRLKPDTIDRFWFGYPALIAVSREGSLEGANWMHTIIVDRESGLVDITVEGFWSLDDLRAFAADLAKALQEATSAGQRSTVLCDYTRAAIQSQEAIAMLQAFMRDPPVRSRKVALFTEGLLAKRQARRLAEIRDNIAVFDDRAAALAWLQAA